MRVLVTGGTGFIGSNIVFKLLEENHKVFATGVDSEQKLPDNVEILGYDFANLDWKKINKLDILFHQAAINDTTLMDRELMFKINVEGTKKLFKNAIENGCKKIVYASSTAIYGNAPAPYIENKTPIVPLNPYAESKKLVEEFVIEFAKDHPDVIIVGLRYCNVYGLGEGKKGKRSTMIYQLAQQMLKGNPRIFKDGEQKRDYIYVKDVVRANILAAKAKQSCIVNCGYGKATTFNELIRILNLVLKTNRVPEYIDNPYLGKYQDYTECDMNLAKKMIGFVPEFDIVSGIKDYYNTGFLVEK